MYHERHHGYNSGSILKSGKKKKETSMDFKSAIVSDILIFLRVGVKKWVRHLSLLNLSVKFLYMPALAV